MPFDVEFDQLPAGYAASSARAEDQTVMVRMREFLTSDDGRDFTTCLEGIPNDLLHRIPEKSRPLPSKIDHLLGVIRPDRTGRIYVNEVSFVLEAHAQRAIEKGEKVFKKDIADIRRVKPDGVHLQPTDGFILVFSIGWRKGVLYDLEPLSMVHGQQRKYDWTRALGVAFAQLMFQERFRLTDSQWDALLRQRWFPFVGLTDTLVNKMLSHVTAGWLVDDMLPQICEHVEALIPPFGQALESQPAFVDHLPVIKRAFQHFMDGDFMSCATMLYPRIEGVMRSHHIISNELDSPSSRRLSTSATAASEAAGAVLLMPGRFRRYLEEVFFANFDGKCVNNAVSRHSVAHGVASPACLDQKAAASAILVLRQLFFCFQSETNADD